LAIVRSIIDERVEVANADEPLQVVVTAENADGRADVDIICKFMGAKSGYAFCETRYSAAERSPLSPHSLVVISATAYGLCVGTRYIWESFRIVRKTYNEVAESEKDAQTPSQRAYHTVNRLPGKNKEFVKAATDVAKGCVIFVAEALISKGAGF
jgi:hypothetical protein